MSPESWSDLPIPPGERTGPGGSEVTRQKGETKDKTVEGTTLVPLTWYPPEKTVVRYKTIEGIFLLSLLFPSDHIVRKDTGI